MLRILSRNRHAVPLPPQLPANPPPARPPEAGPKAPSPYIFNIPRPRVMARLEAIKIYLRPETFFVTQCLVEYLPSRTFHHLDIDRALMTLKNDLTESHRHFRTGQPLTVTFSNTRKGRKQVDVLLDVVLRALFDVEIVLRVYRMTQGNFDSHLKKIFAK